MSAPESFPTALGRLSGLAKANAFALAGFTLLLTAILWPAWTHDPDLTHGLLMPVVFCLLLREGRLAGPPRYFPARASPRRPPWPASRPSPRLRRSPPPDSIPAAVAVAKLCSWNSSSRWPSAARPRRGPPRLRRRAHPALSLQLRSTVVAVGLWPLCAPIPPGTYSRLTLGLQLWVSSGVMDALELLKVAAHRQGNIIQLATGSVGVAEACSGVRSLISCVFVALFFSATLVRRPDCPRPGDHGRRSPRLLAMNFLRALGLTLLVNAGVDITGFWHDATGFAVLGLTAALLAGLAFGLAGGERATSRGHGCPGPPGRAGSSIHPPAWPVRH